MAVWCLSISPCSTNLLYVAFHALWHIVMDDSPHIRFIQTHSKGHSRYHHPQPSRHEGILDSFPLGWGKTSMVALSVPVSIGFSFSYRFQNNMWVMLFFSTSELKIHTQNWDLIKSIRLCFSHLLKIFKCNNSIRLPLCILVMSVNESNW